jgi:hypothetical protein
MGVRAASLPVDGGTITGKLEDLQADSTGTT